MMKITDLLDEGMVLTGMTARTKDQVINTLIDLLGKSPSVLNLEKVRAAIFQRESVMSTGVGHGIAVPHGKTDAVLGTVAAFGMTADPIEFDSLDQTPVRLVFLFIGKDTHVGPHVKLLSRISRMMSSEQFRSRLLHATNPHDVIETFRSEEANLAEA